jgi:predicted ATPase
VQTLAEEGALSGERGSYQLAQPLTTLQLPSTVQAILAARIDRLAPEEKVLLQQLSVIGREFPIEVLYRTTLDDHYSELAHHFSRSGNTPKAVEYLHLAGQQALQRSGTAEAVTQLSAAVALLRTLPDTPERCHHELTLQTTLGPALAVVKGWAAPEIEQLYTRSRELCRQLGESAQSVWVLLGLWGFYSIRAEHQKEHDIIEEILRFAQSVQDPAVQAAAHFVPAWPLFMSGEIVAAREHCEQVIALYDPQQHRSSARYGMDFGVARRGTAALALWLLGYPAQALQCLDDARALAQTLSHLPSVANTLSHAAMLHHLRREEHAAQERA